MTFSVDFVIAGTQKGGTSALVELLKKNCHIFMSSPKELHYFDKDENCVGDKDYQRYHSYFVGCTETQIAGEATPMYMYSYDAPRRIWEYNKNMKFLLLLRNPIERAYSAWNMERYRQIEQLPFSEALNAEKDRRIEALPSQQRNFSYVDRGYYSEQLRRIWNYFPENQTLVLKADDLRNEQQVVLDKVWGFLGVPKNRSTYSVEKFSTPYQRSMTKDEYEFLLDLFYHEVCVLENMLGWDCSDWKRPYDVPRR